MAGTALPNLSRRRIIVISGAGRQRLSVRQSKIEDHFRRIELAKPNYRHVKKQKEAARKARQDAKQQRRSNVPEVPAEPLPLKPREF
jgi:hypothetical protein